MARAHLYRPIIDVSGDLQEGTIVRVLQPDAAPTQAQPVTDSVYASKIGSTTLGVTFTASNGIVDLWMDNPQFVMLGLTPPGDNEFFLDNVPVVGLGAGAAYPTASRPLPATVGVGYPIFDTTLGKPVWSTGTKWVDATGATA